MRIVALVLSALVAFPAPVASCQLGCFDAGSSSGAVVRRATPRVVARPTPRPAARATPRPTLGPAALAASLGLHAVTQVWAGDHVTKRGGVTTYTSATIRQDAGTYAKKVASVSTGQTSAYDVVLSNRRTSMSDGRAVSGDIYANYIWSGSTLRLDRYVFFQDDREVAGQPPATPLATRSPAPTPRSTPTAAPRAARTPTPRTTPRAARQEGRPAPTPTPRPTTRTVRAGIALGPQADTLSRIEVLRGRRVDLWPRATVDGAPAPVVGWRLSAGEVSALGPVAGTGDQPFRAMWEAISANSAPYEVRFEVTVETPGEASRTVDAAILVVVRSPALIE